MQKTSNLKDRIKNPNKDFDALVWRPKSKFWRRFMARYVNYVEIAAYIFVAVIIAAVVFTWALPSTLMSQAKDNPQMKPVVTEIVSPFNGTVGRVYRENGTDVVPGDTLAVITGPSGTGAVMASAGGTVYARSGKEGFDSLPGVEVKKGAALFQVVDFSEYRIEVEFAKYADSINIGDSATVSLIGHSVNKKSGLFLTVINLVRPDKVLSAKVDYALPQKVIDSIGASLTGQEIVVKRQGVFKVASVKEGTFIFRYEADKADAEPASSPVLATRGMVRGVLESGVLSADIEQVRGFPSATSDQFRQWAESYRGTTVGLENGAFVPTRMLASKMRLKLTLEVPLTEAVKYDKLPKEMRKKAVDGGEAKVKGVVRVSNPPDYVRTIARRLYELPAKPQFLNTIVNLSSYRTTWGKRLLKQ